MTLQKQPVPINFAKGLDTKSDPFQVPVGNFTFMENSVFTTTGRLTKRNGFANLTSLPNALQTTLTTLNGNLIATGSSLYAYSQDNGQWLNQGVIQPVNLTVQSLIRNSASQSNPDTAVAPTGLTAVSYVDSVAGACYHIIDSATGQQILGRQVLPNSATCPRTFILNNFFIITYLCTISATPHLQYIAIPVGNPTVPRSPQDISSDVLSNAAGYDGIVANNNLYLSWAGSATTINTAFLSSGLIVSSTRQITGHTALLMSMTADLVNSVLWVTWWQQGSTQVYSFPYDFQLHIVTTVPTPVATATGNIAELTSAAQNGILTVLLENIHIYGGAYPTTFIQTDYLSSYTVDQATGTYTDNGVLLRSVGLASKAFINDAGAIYMLATYGETNQPTYFLIDSTGAVYMRLAYSNGGGYLSPVDPSTGTVTRHQVLASVSEVNSTFYSAYSIKDLLTTVNKVTTSTPAGSPRSAIYTQTGVNLAEFMINNSGQYSSEIANALHLTGGQLWEYDSVKPVEHGFQVWPENLQAVWSASGGSMAAIPVSGGSTTAAYYYQFCYEWTDNEGKLHRSAPSIPLQVNTTGTGTTGEVTLYVPTLRLTYKISPNPVRIVGYRWSQGQQIYYQMTSVTSPVLNDPTVDFVTIVDTQSDATILGNAIIYTNGGVIENIAAPASIASALFKNRLFLVDAEDPNLLWFSKQVIEGVPVEMSDLLTLYVAPTSGAQGSTGTVTALSALDDKLIIFKRDAIYYVTGIGPDNTGANNDFSDPVFITSAVGCPNPRSIVLMPTGLMFQSDKGIWLLGRDLSTSYIGAPVETYNNINILSAQSIPGTNQVRFILANSTMLMYDYYFNQWGTFTNLSAISSALYQEQHTYLNAFGAVLQESPGTYLDSSSPVLMSITTSWLNLAGLQGYERFYFMFLLGTYYTPFKLNVQIAYDYNPSAAQATIVTPDNYSPNWGLDPVWGANGPWGGPGNVFRARIFPQIQKCESFQLTITEIYDNSYGVAPGQGLSLSGLEAVIGVKRGWRTSRASNSFG